MNSLKFLTAIVIALLSVLSVKAQSENKKLESVQITEKSTNCVENDTDGVAKRESAVCALLPDKGPCNGNCTRWYYSGSIQGCLPFTWGCCGGNANNFATYEACMNSCGFNSCPLYVDLGDKPVNTANIEAKQHIIYSGTVLKNQNIQFKAGNQILLKSGFQTSGNSEFKASIDNSCELVITDCANYSGCLAYTGATGQGNHDLFGEFVMPYNNCLLSNIPGTIQNITDSGSGITTMSGDPIQYNPVLDSVSLDNSSFFDCGIPFYANVNLGYIQVMPGINSIEASISLLFNGFYDDINSKILATELIIDGESIKCNDNSVDFYVKTNSSIVNNISCIIYSTDFTNVYVKDFSFSFTVGTVFNFRPPPNDFYIYTPVYSNSNTIDDCSLYECIFGMPNPIQDIGTLVIIFPFPG